MAILKAIHGAALRDAAMRNTIQYVLRDDKVRDGYVAMLGPGPDELNWDTVFRSFRDEQQLWGKHSGRLCTHYVVSFHHDEQIDAAEVLTFASDLAEQVFGDHQVLIGVHQDRGHLHAHMVVNGVSYVDGHKLHTSAKDLQDMKDIINRMCLERGLTVAQKGRHFDGSEMDDAVSVWDRNKYHVLQNDKGKSYLASCHLAVTESMERSESREDFIREMGDHGWSVAWTDRRRHLTFQNTQGQKVRDSNLSKTFNIDISKEALELTFARSRKRRQEHEQECEQELLDQYIHQPEQEEIACEDYYQEVMKTIDHAASHDVSDDDLGWERDWR